MGDEGHELEVDSSHFDLVTSWFPELKPDLLQFSKPDDDVGIETSRTEDRFEDKTRQKRPSSDKSIEDKLKKHVKYIKRKDWKEKKATLEENKEHDSDIDDRDSKVAMVTASKVRASNTGQGTASSLEDLQNKLKDDKLSKSAKKRLRKRINKLLLSSKNEDKDKDIESGRQISVTEKPKDDNHLSTKVFIKNDMAKDQSEVSFEKDQPGETCDSNKKHTDTARETLAERNTAHLKRKLNENNEGVESKIPRKEEGGDLLDEGGADSLQADSSTKPYKRKRKKKRSKQKNIKKDNRPDHLKPPHLRAKIETTAENKG